MYVLMTGGNGGITKNVNTSCLKRQHSSGSEEHGKSGVGVRRWISLDDLAPQQTCEEQSYICLLYTSRCV